MEFCFVTHHAQFVALRRLAADTSCQCISFCAATAHDIVWCCWQLTRRFSAFFSCVCANMCKTRNNLVMLVKLPTPHGILNSISSTFSCHQPTTRPLIPTPFHPTHIVKALWGITVRYCLKSPLNVRTWGVKIAEYIFVCLYISSERFSSVCVS